MDVVYRDATPEDCDALSALMRETFMATFGHLYSAEDSAAFVAASYTPAQQYAELIDTGMGTRLAERGGALVGYAQIGPLKLPIDPGPARALELYRLYLREEVQGAGVADALMNWAMTHMRARNATQAFLGVWCENVRAQKFYARHGFVQVGAYRFPVGAQLDDEFILRAALS